MALTTFVAGQVLQAQQLNDSYAAVDWNENVIINGAMQVAQRGTSTAGITTNGYYTADRFPIALTTLGTWTQSLEADAPTGSGFRNSVKMLCTTADGSPAAADLLSFQQRIEGQNLQQFLKGTASAKTFVLSFWVKSNVTGTYIANLVDVDNTRIVSASYTISVSATWEKKTITFPADTTGAFNNDNANSLTLQFYLGAGTDYTSGTLQTTWAANVNANRAVGQTNLASAINNYWQITGVQLQPSRESQFLFQDYGTVLAQCQRYYFRNTPGSSYGNHALVSSNSSTFFEGPIFLPVTMRTAPTSVDYANLVITDPGVNNHAVTALAISQSGPTIVQLDVTVASSAIAQGDAVLLRNNNNVAGYLGLSAEL